MSPIKLVCDACQKAKSHQLPYSKSINVSRAPLDLICSDVWGSAPQSVGRNKYYVSFIDDYSRFTWIYLIKNKSDVFQVFVNFQQLVERLFNKKIITLQTDWGGEYQKLNSFFQRLEFPIMFLALMLINKTELLSANTVILSKWGLLSLPMLLCLSNFGMKPSPQLLIL